MTVILSAAKRTKDPAMVSQRDATGFLDFARNDFDEINSNG
jgi:hypothetical protein